MAFDAIQEGLDPTIRRQLGWHKDPARKKDKRLVRLAALLHDIGHTPFSHVGAGPKTNSLCPDGYSHEKYGEQIIHSSDIAGMVSKEEGPEALEDIIIIAGLAPPLQLRQRLLSELIAGTIGVDRLDYLPRDSLYTGATAGRCDIERLIYTMRVLRHPKFEDPLIVIDLGGILAVEEMIFARHAMRVQVYIHPICDIYGLHLREFLRDHLPEGRWPTDINDYLQYDDHRIWEEMRWAYQDPSMPGYLHATRLHGRNHFRCAYEVTTRHMEDNALIYQQLEQEVYNRFPRELIRTVIAQEDVYSTQKEGDLIVLTLDGPRNITAQSEILQSLALTFRFFGRIYAAPEKKEEVRRVCAEFVRKETGYETA